MKRIRWINGIPHECLGDEAARWDAEFRVCKAIISTICRVIAERVPILNYEPGYLIFNPEPRRIRAHIPTVGRVYHDQNNEKISRRLGEIYFYEDVWLDPIQLIHAVEEPYEAHIHEVFKRENLPLEALEIEARLDSPRELTPYERLHLMINHVTLPTLEMELPSIEARLQRESPITFEEDARDEEFGKTTHYYRLPDGRVISEKVALQDPVFQKAMEERGGVFIEKTVTKHPVRDPVLRYERKILERLYSRIPEEKEIIQRLLGWRGEKPLKEIVEAIEEEKRDIDFKLNHDISDFL